jgi:D-amino-acid dehydrogenase
VEVLKRYGIPYQCLDSDGCVDFEPGLSASRDRFVGGLRLPSDETGDCHLFTTRLAELLARQGVEFRYNTTIHKLHVERGRIAQVVSDQGPITADRYVVALAAYAPALLRPLGIRLPIYPVKGYSITAAIADSFRAPVSTLLDETYKVAGSVAKIGGSQR